MDENFKTWVNEKLFQKKELIFNQLKGDAGKRQYYEIEGFLEKLAVFSPPKSEKNRAFLEINKSYSQAGLKVCKIFSFDIRKGYFLIENLGNVHLIDVNKKEQKKFYKLAIDKIIRLGKITTTKLGKLAVYDKNLLEVEFDIFLNYFLEKFLALRLDQKQTKILINLKQLLINNSFDQQQVAVHRDFHSKNLMILKNDIAILDYQDSVIGPVCYDLASLLKDCYITLDQKLYEELLKYSYEILQEQSLVIQDFIEFKKNLDFCAVQRHLKVFGIFSRLHILEKKHDYLSFMPRIYSYLSQTCQEYKELFPFFVILNDLIKPNLEEKLQCKL